MALNEAQFQEKFKGMFVSPDRAAELLREARGTICRIGGHLSNRKLWRHWIFSVLVLGRLCVPATKLPLHGHGLHACRCAGSPALQRHVVRGALNGVFYARLMCLYSCSNAGALQGLSLPSPYLDIVSMSQRRAPSEDTRTARLIFDHALMVHQEAVADPPVLLDITYKSLLLCCLLGTNSRSALHSLWPYCGHPAGKPARNNFER